MRLNDLLGSLVIDEAGEPAGRVHEVRAVQNGPLQDAFGAALTLDGLIVGRGSIGTRLGLDRSDARSPAALRIIFEHLKGQRLYVPWDSIIAIEQGRIIVSGRIDDLEEPAQLSSSEQVEVGSSG
jgi:sporulation protein YlmC with PRC-barrel domain